MTTKPTKRPRTDTLTEPAQDPERWTRHPELYFSDGNIVLICDNTVFKVWQGILAVNSEVFQDLFSLAIHQPESIEKYDDQPLIRLHDSAEDMQALLQTLCVAKYSIKAGELPAFKMFSSVLRLSTKYMMYGVRAQMVKLAELMYPATYDAWLAWCSSHPGNVKPPGVYYDHKPYRRCADLFPSENPHPNVVINLFRKCHLMKCLPMAYHDARVYGIVPLFDEGEGMSLSPEDVRVTVLGGRSLFMSARSRFRELLQILMYLDCSKCEDFFTDVERGLSFYNDTLETPAYPSPLTPICDAHFIRYFCDECLDEAKRFDKGRCDAWKSLPSVFRLPPWEELNNDP